MIINEDYFKDITDDDIENITSPDSDILNTQEPINLDTLNTRLNSKYKHCILTKTYYFKNLFSANNIIWNNVRNMIKRLSYMLNTYNIDYEYIIRDESHGKVLKEYNVGEFTVLSTYREKMFFDPTTRPSMYIIFYTNLSLPLTYKESYYFIDRLYNTIYSPKTAIQYTESVMHNMLAFSQTYITENTMNLLYSMDHLDEIQLQIDPTEIYKCNQKLPFKTFFKQAISFFHNSTEDERKIKEMLAQIEKGKNPFDRT